MSAPPDPGPIAGGSPRIILVGSRGGANVGSACRAIKNMSAGALVTVASSFDHAQAKRMAVHGRDVLAASREVETLDEAISGCGLVVGTTARRGAYRVRPRPIREVARELVRWELERCRSELSPAAPFAFVFGPEDRGLSNDEITLCHRLAYIPTGTEYTSLNLAQAVLTCTYEVLMARIELEAEAEDRTAASEIEEVDPDAAPADAAEVAEMFRQLERSLVEIGFLDEDRPERIMATLRSLFSRSGLERREVGILRGVARQIGWFATGGAEVARRKRAEGRKLR